MLRNWIPSWAILTLVLFSIGTVWLRLMIVRTTYAINQTNHETELAKQERENLQLKAAALRSPRRLEILARTQFGLSLPDADQVIYPSRPPRSRSSSTSPRSGISGRNRHGQ